VIGVGVDANYHVFIVHRNDTFDARNEIGAAQNPPLSECCVPAPPVLVDPEDLDQLLTSMVTFGRDLLPAGGSLTVEVLPPAGAAQPGQSSTGSGATVLAVTASGYGVQLPADAPAVDLVARRCGAALTLSGEAGWMVRLDVQFPRCGNPQRSGWTWSTE